MASHVLTIVEPRMLILQSLATTSSFAVIVLLVSPRISNYSDCELTTYISSTVNHSLQIITHHGGHTSPFKFYTTLLNFGSSESVDGVVGATREAEIYPRHPLSVSDREAPNSFSPCRSTCMIDYGLQLFLLRTEYVDV
jgi:hypothetical protein